MAKVEQLQETVPTPKYDGELNLSLADNRMAKHWKNQTMNWSAFLKRLQQPTQTQETLEEYRRASKAKQSEIKDVGGFVGGFLNQGKRKADMIQNRSILTLDVDFPKGFLWDSVELLLDNAAALYSTHHYSDKSKRVRLIVPLARPVTPDEYQPLARKVADIFGMDLFDDTTYQPERLMFWPSYSRDAEYKFEWQDGPWLDPDAWLAKYPDWRDASYWPESSRSDGIRQKAAEKAGDPLEKPGVIGVFCRTYTIEEAITEFLADVYEPTGHADRYTYSAGSTAGGLVLYDDKFAYSHHSTDPVGDQLTNAWDLVRIHKFGNLDEEASPKTNINKLPSSKAMKDWAKALPAVHKALVQESINSAQSDFDEDPDADDSWTEELTLDNFDQIEPTAGNLELIMLNDANLKANFWTDTFTHRVFIKRDVPWRSVEHDQFWSDTDDAGLRIYIEKTYGISSRNKVDDALALEVQRNSVHPVREYLNALTWDGVPRLETLLVDYLGAMDTPYTRMVTRKFLAAAVARVMKPGCKFDYMLITSGVQGLGKSTLPAKLGGRWYSDTLDTVSGKEAYEALQGVWIMEMGELKATKKADIEATKLFISKTEDAFRPAYGRRKQYFPRQTVFWGTSNDPQFLRDRTGNRRYWPVDVGVQDTEKKPFEDLDQATIDQVWAEAVVRYNAGEKLYLDKDEEQLALEQQELHTEESSLEGMILDFLEVPIPDDWYTRSANDRRQQFGNLGSGHDELQPSVAGQAKRMKVCVLEVWVELLGGDPKNLAPVKAAEIRNILNNLTGWVRHRTSEGRLKFGPGYGKQVAYVRDPVGREEND